MFTYIYIFIYFKFLACTGCFALFTKTKKGYGAYFLYTFSIKNVQL